ncbi:MAG: hypothetical protein WBD20_13480 [Pirellulaceae bacterium]
MIRLFVLPAVLIAIGFNSVATAQTYRPVSDTDSAAARMRPIGSPSAVDQYRQPNRYQETAYSGRTDQYGNRVMGDRSSAVRQVAMLQSGGLSVPPLPGDVGSDLNTVNQPTLAPRTMPGLQGQPLPNNPLPSNPLTSLPPGSSPLIASPSDMTPMPQPNLNSGFATVDNCNCVSPASGYTAASGIGCGSNLGYISPASCQTPVAPGYLPQNYGYDAPPAQIAGPAVMPVAPGFATGGLGTDGFGTGRVPRALISLGQQNYPVQVGQGLWGQPVAYVPGQSLRNWVRYFFP